MLFATQHRHRCDPPRWTSPRAPAPDGTAGTPPPLGPPGAGRGAHRGTACRCRGGRGPGSGRPPASGKTPDPSRRRTLGGGSGGWRGRGGGKQHFVGTTLSAVRPSVADCGHLGSLAGGNSFSWGIIKFLVARNTFPLFFFSLVGGSMPPDLDDIFNSTFGL